MDTAYDKGLVTRKQVMGEDYVAKALDSATEFTLPIQEHITRAAHECHALIIEPRGVVNTGDAGGRLTARNDVWT